MSFPHGYFDVELPTDGATSWALIGASRAGKSTLLKYILKRFFKREIITMFTMNPHADMYKTLPNHYLVSDEYTPELIHDAYMINKMTDNKYKFLFVSDDYVDHRIKNDAEVTRLLTIYRNCGLSSIFSFQGRTLMNATGRNNINYIAIFKQNTAKEYEDVVRDYLMMWLPSDMTVRQAVEFVMRMTQHHHFFFIDNIKGKCYLSRLNEVQFEEANEKIRSVL